MVRFKSYELITDDIFSGQCPHHCHVTRDKSLQNRSSAIIFHLPNLHWEAEIETELVSKCINC